jgi:hypothetical protein
MRQTEAPVASVNPVIRQGFVRFNEAQDFLLFLLSQS